MISRRDAIQLMLVSLAATHTAACSQQVITSVAELEQNRVIIIGAGMAGLKVAHDLQAAGFKVTIIESRDRLGGRTWTDQTLGVPLDLGASWIHGVRGNPIKALAAELETPLFEWDYDNGQLTNLSRTNGPILESLLQQVERGLYRAFDQLSTENADVTVADVVQAAHRTEVFKGFNQQEIDFALRVAVELDVAADAADVSALGVIEGEAFGGEDVLLVEGYGRIIEHLATGLDIRYSERVTEIDYGGARVVLGTDQDAYSADFVVSTVPVGVLAQNKIGFMPPLPEAKQNAIAGLNMGLLNKVFLRFDDVFWPTEIDQFMQIPEAGMRWPVWFNLANMHDAPILFALNCGQDARDIEALSDAEIIAEAMQSIRNIFGAEVPEPSDYLITRWASDPHAYGAYSHLKPGYAPQIRRDLAAPLRGLLYFAGEATSADYPATVHGAFLSGSAAGEAILDQVLQRETARQEAEKADKAAEAVVEKPKKKPAAKDDGH